MSDTPNRLKEVCASLQLGRDLCASMCWEKSTAAMHDGLMALDAHKAEITELLDDALDLIPRMSDDDPIAPALADWCKKARALVRIVNGERARV